MNDRPSDAMTGKVVFEWMGWESALIGNKVFVEYNQSQKGDTGFVADPRDSDECAMELLHHISVHQTEGICIYPQMNGTWLCEWRVDSNHIMDKTYLPISGPAFRYAVVNLAAKVMGLEEDKEVQSCTKEQ